MENNLYQQTRPNAIQLKMDMEHELNERSCDCYLRLAQHGHINKLPLERYLRALTTKIAIVILSVV